MRLTVALRSPVAFRLPGPLTLEAMAAPAEPVSIEFEERTFVWHPPMETESAILGREQLGPPMVAVIVAGDPAAPDAAASLQRFLSAVAFWLTEPVTDVSGNGGDGGSDAFNPPWQPRAACLFRDTEGRRPCCHRGFRRRHTSHRSGLFSGRSRSRVPILRMRRLSQRPLTSSTTWSTKKVKESSPPKQPAGTASSTPRPPGLPGGTVLRSPARDGRRTSAMRCETRSLTFAGRGTAVR